MNQTISHVRCPHLFSTIPRLPLKLKCLALLTELHSLEEGSANAAIAEVAQATVNISQDDQQPDGSEFAMGQRQFTLFPNLPTELRCKIWQYALPAPRVVEVKSTPPCSDNMELMHYGVDYNGLTWNASCDESAPVCFFVCHEARSEVSKKYKKVQGTEPGTPAVYCDLERDFIFFSFSHFHRHHAMRTLLKGTDPERKIKRIVADMENFFFQWPDPTTDLYDLSSNEELIIIDSHIEFEKNKKMT